jgi:hypothetical protein
LPSSNKEEYRSLIDVVQTYQQRHKRREGIVKQNCWEFKKCGREPGGSKAQDLGVCPAATEPRLNGTNDGKNGGRACWALTGTLCGGQVQGTFAAKVGNCAKCEFYQTVVQEEGANQEGAKDILAKLK